LFIYLVYILAFVGAVLMLFLSVVLMLPISTIHKSSFFSPVLMVASISNVPLTAVSLRPGGLESQSVPFSLPPVESLFSPGYALFVLVLLITYSMVISQLVT
jgi:NADH:ubiquinone oxidoreductase subunit 6 (subunit J)